MKKSEKIDWLMTLPIGMLIIYVGFLICIFLLFICGVYHAFGASPILGILSILFNTFTILIEFVDWFSDKEIWKEIARALGI